MKTILCFIFLIASLYTNAQGDNPKEVTPQMLQKITINADKEALLLKQKIAKEELSELEKEFAVDTFKIEYIAEKKMDIDYSTAGMNKAEYERAEMYDKLLNKYYQKLLKALKLEDKQALIAAQKAWITFRDAEKNLIATMSKEQYSGGGTIQSNIRAVSYSQLVTDRVFDMFNYLNDIEENAD